MYVINIEVDLQGVLLKFPGVFTKFSGQAANAVTYTGQDGWFAPCHCNNFIHGITLMLYIRTNLKVISTSHCGSVTGSCTH